MSNQAPATSNVEVMAAGRHSQLQRPISATPAAVSPAGLQGVEPGPCCGPVRGHDGRRKRTGQHENPRDHGKTGYQYPARARSSPDAALFFARLQGDVSVAGGRPAGKGGY